MGDLHIFFGERKSFFMNVHCFASQTAFGVEITTILKRRNKNGREKTMNKRKKGRQMNEQWTVLYENE